VNVTTVVAVCGSTIALASLGLSVYQAQATRQHNRLSVQPLLELEASFNEGKPSGLRLRNSGLGPAKITNSKLTLGDKLLGDFSKPVVDQLRKGLNVWPHASTFGQQPSFLDTHAELFLLGVDKYEPSKHDDLRTLIEDRLQIEIQYDSIYGGERFTVAYPDDR
jgi:hypothetical protein